MSGGDQDRHEGRATDPDTIHQRMIGDSQRIHPLDRRDAMKATDILQLEKNAWRKP
jgi:hypothetical protein